MWDWEKDKRKGKAMKAERIKIAANENAEISVRHAGGKYGIWLVGPGSVSVVKQTKRKKAKK